MEFVYFYVVDLIGGVGLLDVSFVGIKDFSFPPSQIVQFEDWGWIGGFCRVESYAGKNVCFVGRISSFCYVL